MATRRNILQGAGVTAALAAVPVMAARAQGLVVYDSRLPESAHFAAQWGGPAHDIARGQPVPLGGRIEGLTRWSDYVALRLMLRGAGMRAGAQSPVSAPLSGHDGLIRWTLEPRLGEPRW